MAEGDRADVVNAKRERGRLFDEFSKSLRILRQDILTPEHRETVQIELGKLRDAFAAFESSHLQCLDLIVSDPETTTSFEAQYVSAVKAFKESTERTEDWLRRQEKDDRDSVSGRSSASATRHHRIAERKKQRMIEQHRIERERLELDLKHHQQRLDMEAEIDDTEETESLWDANEAPEKVSIQPAIASRNQLPSFDNVVTERPSLPEEAPQRATDAPLGPQSPPSAPTPTGQAETRYVPPPSVTAKTYVDARDSASQSSDDAFSRLANALQESFSLPKPEILTFSGDVMDYSKFIRNFETSVEARVPDDRARLSYLIQYCNGEAKRAIEVCVLLDPSQGYRKAREILLSRYGRPYQIARAYVDRLTQGSQIRPHDVKALSDLSLELQRCEITLSQMGFGSDVDNSENMLRIVRRLPHYLRVKWVDVAQSILDSGREPKFTDLVNFVENKSRTATSMYGLDLVREERVNSPRPPHVKPRVTTLSTQSATPKRVARGCACCNGGCADLAACTVFSNRPLRERWATVKQLRLCKNCLKRNHFARECRKPSACNVTGCDTRHHALLHSLPKRAPDQTPVSVTATNCNQKSETLLGIIPVEVMGTNGRSVRTYALFDDGSQQTFCDERLLQTLGIQGKPVTYEVSTLTSQQQKNSGVETDLAVRSLDGSNSVVLKRVWPVKRLGISSNPAPRQSDVAKYAHLKDIKIPQIKATDVMLLIGCDSQAQVPLEVRSSGVEGEPYATRTALGWVIRGPSSRKGNATASVNFLRTDSLRDTVEKMWTTDFSESLSSDKAGWSVEDRRANDMMEDSITIDNGHYKMDLPWRDENAHLPNNISQAHVRLSQLKRRLERDPDLHQKYTEQINDYIGKGHAEEVLNTSRPPKRLWYLPHQPVQNENKPGKVRVVFDGASKFQGVSLNSELLQGPDYFNSLVGVLMRFRQEQVAVAADIESMFHQVKVSEHDRDALRFLWWPNGDLNVTPKEYRMTVHIFGAKSSPSCTTYALRKTADDNKQQYSEETVSNVFKSFYVDDFLKSVRDDENAIQMSGEMQSLLSKGGFRLTKFISNSQSVLDSIPSSERAASVKENTLCDDSPNERALGVRWNVYRDELTFDAKVPEKPTTRRGILSAISSLFDPLGLAAPVTLKAKAILQDLCRQKLTWDDEVPIAEGNRWAKWLAALPNLKTVKVPRCYKPAKFGPIADTQLHIFCDASETGYGACAYVRFTNDQNDVTTSLVMGKSRLTPLKQVSIPRLELSAAVLASRLYAQVREELELEIERTVFWTDSMITLSYIQNESRRFKAFVANRLGVIHENTDVDQWRHVPTAQKPADLASRGIDADDALSLKAWLEGPEFLKQPKDEWPQTGTVPRVEEDDHETRTHVVSNAIRIDDDPVQKLFNRYSDWHRLQRAVTWILRFKKYCIVKYLKRDCDLPKADLTVDEIRDASVQIFNYVQRQCFTDEAERLKRGSAVLKESKLVPLNPVYEEGLIRVAGLLRLSSLDTGTKAPVVLPEKHAVTSLIIASIHKDNGHVGMNQVLALAREKYWILRGRGAIKRIIRNCIECRRRNSRPCHQQMAPLQPERMTPDNPPFTNIGVDYFGPLTVKVGRTHCKRYGVIFTCLATRAIHLEIAHTLDTDSFLAAFQRFVSRRGRPRKVFSDNGTNLTAGERELREALVAWNQEKIARDFLQKEINWHFNPPHASHAGGAWERMIRSVRKVLKSLAGEQLLTDEALLTLFAEVEKIINDRPITYVSQDPSDPDPLSPNKLLLMRSNSCLPYGTFDKNESYARRWWKQVQYLANVFWRRWIREYLPALQLREKWQRPHRNMRVNDIVLVGDENVPRGQWPLGRVVSVNVGRDGHVRSCVVKTGKTELVRPIVKLYLLEGSD